MSSPLFAGGLVSFVNFGVHAVMTGLIVIITRRVARATDALHIFMRITALLTITVIALTVAHVLEIALWAGFMRFAGITVPEVGVFEFAFENYVSLGYGDAVAGGGWRLIGPIMALNGLLLIGWSVAIIFEVMKMAEFQVGLREKRPR